MIWIVRNPEKDYRIFNQKPNLVHYLDMDGNPCQSTHWITKIGYIEYEGLQIQESESPINLMPGEGPYQIIISIIDSIPQRPFQGEGI